ncbi:hypothetical protein N9L18_00155 [Candidatus Pacebacteria bacterium]|nr:hypothetical protein [Candidatus Paceibacterota bacterium]
MKREQKTEEGIGGQKNKNLDIKSKFFFLNSFLIFSLVFSTTFLFGSTAPVAHAQQINTGVDIGGNTIDGTFSSIEDDSPALRFNGQSINSSDDFEDALGDIAGDVLECSIENILSSGISGILKGLGGALFGGDGGSGDLVGALLGAVGLGSLGGVLGGGGQAVPVNTVSINADVKAQTAKEIGSVNSGSLFEAPSLDSIAYCLSNAVIQYTSEGSARWLAEGYNGNPTYIENYPRLFRDQRIIETENYLNELAANSACSFQDVETLRQIAQEASGQPVYTQRCVYEDYINEDPNDIETYLAQWGNPNSNNVFRNMKIRAELDQRIASNQEVTKLEAVIHEGQLSEKDPRTGDIIVPGNVQFAQAINRINLPEQRLGLTDEIGEALDQLFDAIFSIVPGYIVKKIFEDD